MWIRCVPCILCDGRDVCGYGASHVLLFFVVVVVVVTVGMWLCSSFMPFILINAPPPHTTQVKQNLPYLFEHNQLQRPFSPKYQGGLTPDIS